LILKSVLTYLKINIFYNSAAVKSALTRKKPQAWSLPMKPRFTLVELLVVIVIVAILLSLLIGAMGRSRDKAYVVQCLSNLSNAGKASVMLRTERKGRYPNKADSTQYGWVGKTPIAASGYRNTLITERLFNKYLSTFVAGDPVLVGKCPSDNWMRLSTGNPKHSSYDWAGSSYAANTAGQVGIGASVYSPNNLADGDNGIFQTSIKSPSQMVELIEYGGLGLVRI
jgi:prepilin-type N-terminal cleavage/methylation domain-containing protein